MKMYSTFSDTQRCISDNKLIIAKVVAEWNREINKISTKIMGRVSHAHGMWITRLNFAIDVIYMYKCKKHDEKRLIFGFYSLPLFQSDFS